MKNEDILIKDICGRIPYGLRLNVEGETNTYTLLGVANDSVMVMSDDKHTMFLNIKRVKPYLFSFLSMTREQQNEANVFDDMDMDILSENLDRNRRDKTNIPTPTYNYTDWLDKNHFDYRGLISKGLAIDASKLNIY